MKIMTYNVLDGGFDIKNGSRLDKIINVIKNENPDFLALQETDNFEKNGSEILKRFSEELFLPYYSYASGEAVPGGGRYHVASLSRCPIIDSHTFSGNIFGGAALSTLVETALGEISFCNIHLNAYSEDHRMDELTVVLEYQSKFEKQIILGDHNALSESDDYGDMSTYEFTHCDLHRSKVIKALEKSYIDTSFYLKTNEMRTHPTEGVEDPISKTQVRIDYIFTKKTLIDYVKKVEVIKTKSTEIASDHYPVTATLV